MNAARHRALESSSQFDSPPSKLVVAALGLSLAPLNLMPPSNELPESTEYQYAVPYDASEQGDTLDPTTNTIEIPSVELDESQGGLPTTTASTPINSKPAVTDIFTTSSAVVPSPVPTTQETEPTQLVHEGFLGLPEIAAAPPEKVQFFDSNGRELFAWDIVAEAMPEDGSINPSVALTPGDMRATWYTNTGMPNTELRGSDAMDKSVTTAADDRVFIATHASDSSSPTRALAGQNLQPGKVHEGDIVHMTSRHGVFEYRIITVSATDKLLANSMDPAAQVVFAPEGFVPERGKAIFATCYPGTTRGVIVVAELIDAVSAVQ